MQPGCHSLTFVVIANCYRRPQVWQHANKLRTAIDRIPGLTAYGGEAATDSPIIHVQLTQPPASTHDADWLLQAIVDHMLRNSGILVSVTKYSKIDVHRPPSSIKIFVNAALTVTEVTKTATALKNAAKSVL